MERFKKSARSEKVSAAISRSFENRFEIRSVIASRDHCFDGRIMQKRLHIYYAGSVQGVGFRFTVERTANSLGLSGWVRNLGDGRVEAVVEGEETALESFRKKIRETFDDYIRQADEVSGKATGEFESFDIRF